MNNYLNIYEGKDNIQLILYIEEKVLKIGEKINEINKEAYMNGYNWEIFFNYYLEKYEPEIFEKLNTDAEADTYIAIFELNSENNKKANKFANIINNFLENENKLYEFIKNEGNKIEWD